MKLMLAALVATSAIAIVAAVFAIWPVVADAPWEDDDSTAARFTEAEVIFLVRAEVGTSAVCGRKWAAAYQGEKFWYVSARCGDIVPSMIPERSDSAMWSFRESGERVIPLNSPAETFSP